MIKRAKLSIAAIAAVALAIPINAAQSPSLQSIYGTWQNEAKTGWIKISDCENRTPCGKMTRVSLKPGVSKLDIHNPNSSLRKRPLVGIRLLWGFQRDRNRWTSGKIYNPQNGKTYRATLEAIGNGKLKVRGCVGPFCRSQIWTRAQ
ncbi:MAG: DUF2147 domain-containing protein [Parasphingorhabdus sp.]